MNKKELETISELGKEIFKIITTSEQPYINVIINENGIKLVQNISFIPPEVNSL